MRNRARAGHRTTTAVIVASGLLAGCSGGGEGSTDAAPDRKGPIAIEQVPRQQVLPDLTAEPPYLRTSVPRTASFPPRASVPLLDDPPGRAVAVMAAADSHAPHYESYKSFDDIDLYVYGVDGRWRSLNLGELGIDPGDFSSEAVVAEPSPDGRHLAFTTRTRAALLDLATGGMELIELGPGRWLNGRPEWLGDGRLAVPWTPDFRSPGQWLLVDPDTGARRPWHGPDIYRVTFDQDGPSYHVNGSPDSSTKSLVTYDPRGAVRSRVPMPFRLPGWSWSYAAPTRFALTGPKDLVVVTDRDANPVTTGTLRAGLLTGFPIGWLDDETLLIYADRRRPDPAGDRYRRYYAWRPDTGSVFTVTRLADDTALELALDVVRPR